jgi:hypothetical protein
MPRGPKGEKRPADVIGAAVMVAKIATAVGVRSGIKPVPARFLPTSEAVVDRLGSIALGGEKCQLLSQPDFEIDDERLFAWRTATRCCGVRALMVRSIANSSSMRRTASMAMGALFSCANLKKYLRPWLQQAASRRPTGRSRISADEPRKPLAVLRVPPTQKQVVEHMCEGIDHAISVARSRDDLVAIAQLLEKALKEAERPWQSAVPTPC